MKFKKLSMGLVAFGSSAALLSTAVLSAGCTNKAHPKKPSQMIAKVQLKDNLKLTADELKNAPKIAMITDGGDLFDKSFNQSSWEGVINFAEQSGLPFSKYNAFETKEDYALQYQNALQDGNKILVLSGFHHKDQLKQFYLSHKNLFLDENQKPKVTIVTVDFVLEEGTFAPGLAVTLNFKTKQGGFLAGYAAATYMKDQPEALRTFASFGGGLFPGVTDFMEGFYKGVLYYNSQQTDNNKKYFSKQATNVYTDSGFVPTKIDKQSDVQNQIFKFNPALVMPVAGPWTSWTANSDYFKSPDKYVVGVDVDQYYADTKNGSKYFTSVLKNMSQAVYETLANLIKGNASSLGGYVKGESDGTLLGGVEEKWVDLSPTHLTKRKQDAQNALALAKSTYNSLDDATKYWIVSGKVEMNDFASESNIQTRLNKLSQLNTKEAQTQSVSENSTN